MKKKLARSDLAIFSDGIQQDSHVHQ